MERDREGKTCVSARSVHNATGSLLGGFRGGGGSFQTKPPRAVSAAAVARQRAARTLVPADPTRFHHLGIIRRKTC